MLLILTQDLRESDDALRRFVKNAPVALAMFDREARFVELSPHWERHFARTSQELIGERLQDVFAALPPSWQAAVSRGLKGESQHVSEQEWTHADGSSSWFRLELGPWFDAEGEIGGIVLFVENISAGKAIDAILRMISVEVTQMDLDDFLDHCTRRISEILGLEWVQLARPCADQPGWAETIAASVDGQAAETMRYALAGSPCDITLRQKSCIFPSGVSALFPEDTELAQHGIEGYAGHTLFGSKGELLGFLTVMSRRAIPDEDQLSTTLRLTAVALGAVLERRRAEQEVKTNERFNRDLLDTLPSHIAVLDSSGSILFTNRAWNIFGTDNGSIALHAGVGVNYLTVCDRAASTEPEAAKAAALIRDVIAGRAEQGRFEYPCHGAHAQRWFNCTVKHFTDPERDLILVSHADITEIKLAQRRTEELERKFRHLFESAPEAMIIVSGAGIIRLSNRKAEAMFGYGTVMLEGQSVMVLVQERGQEGPIAALKQKVAALESSDSSVVRGTFFGLRRNGSEFPVEVSLSQFESDDDEYFIVAIRDLTTRLQAEADRVAREVAESASIAKSAFLATMSHEIRTPLNAVLGLSEVLARSPLSAEQADLLGDMRGSARHLLHLIDNVLDFSKIEAGNLEFDRGVFDLHELIESNARGVSNLAAERDVALHVFVAPSLPREIVSDQVRLRQIVYNLLGNAIKFTAGVPGRRGCVWLRAEPVDGTMLRLTVRDNGIGMSPEALQKVFSPFTQAASDTTRRFGGTGLGLTITKRIVDGLGGAIDIDAAPDKGAIVTIMLPLEASSEPAAMPPGRLPGLRCLVVPSDAYLAGDLAAYLAHEGARVSVISAGEEAAQTGEGVLILGVDDARPPGVPSSMPQVQIGNDESFRLDIRKPGRVFVESRGMTRDDLVKAVTLAIGRKRPGVADVLERRSEGTLPTFSVDPEAPPTILVVEDDPLNQKVILHQLALLGLSADIAEDGDAALRLWQEKRYNLILSDLHMPRMDGFALTRAIREAEARSDARVPILALTANALNDEIGKTREAGFDDFITKPMTIARLTEIVGDWLPRSASQ